MNLVAIMSNNETIFALIQVSGPLVLLAACFSILAFGFSDSITSNGRSIRPLLSLIWSFQSFTLLTLLIELTLVSQRRMDGPDSVMPSSDFHERH